MIAGAFGARRRDDPAFPVDLCECRADRFIAAAGGPEHPPDTVGVTTSELGLAKAFQNRSDFSLAEISCPWPERAAWLLQLSRDPLRAETSLSAPLKDWPEITDRCGSTGPGWMGVGRQLKTA